MPPTKYHQNIRKLLYIFKYEGGLKLNLKGRPIYLTKLFEKYLLLLLLLS